MSAFDEKIAEYLEQAKSLGISVDEDLLRKVAKGLGPSIYNDDSALVSSSDSEELARVKNNFLIGKLGLADGPGLDEAISEVIDTFGSSNRNKTRALFYYLLVKKLKKESIFE